MSRPPRRISRSIKQQNFDAKKTDTEQETPNRDYKVFPKSGMSNTGKLKMLSQSQLRISPTASSQPTLKGEHELCESLSDASQHFFLTMILSLAIPSLFWWELMEISQNSLSHLFITVSFFCRPTQKNKLVFTS